MSYKIFLFIHIALLLISCSTDSAHKPYKVFHYNEDVGITSLDPAFASDQSNIWAVSQVYEGLIELDSSLLPKPCLAKSYQLLDSGKLLRFEINTQIRFHINQCFGNQYSRYISAKDVEYSFNRLMDPKTASKGAWIFNGKINSELINTNHPLRPFKAVGDSIFELRLNQAFAPILALLAMPYCSVIPHEAIEFYGNDFRKNPVGTGPFQFDYWDESVKLILKKNPFYHQFIENQRIPKIDFVEISFIASKQTAFMEFAAGKLDMINGLESSYKDELLNKDASLKDKYKEKFNLQVSPFLNTEYLGISLLTPNSLLNKADFRKALSLSIDREKMIKYLKNGIGDPIVFGFIPQGIPHKPQIPSNYSSYNPALAKKYLSGLDLSEELVIYTNKNYLDIAVFIQNEWKQLGIKSKIEVNPGSFHRQRVSKGEFPLFRGSWIADYPDAENYLALFYSPFTTPNGPNTFFYKNTHFDQLYEQISASFNPELREDLINQAIAILEEDCPAIVLFYDKSLRLYSKKIKNFRNDAMNRLILKSIEIE